MDNTWWYRRVAIALSVGVIGIAYFWPSRGPKAKVLQNDA